MAASILGRNAHAFQNMMTRSRVVMQITLEGQEPSKVNSYTTLDTIKGEVTLTADHDTPFDKLHISFEGTSRVVIERPDAASPIVGRTDAFHMFLKLIQPIQESQYPEGHILKGGETYVFPFTFVVPENLIHNSCGHKLENPQIAEEHNKLPPSFGDPTIAGYGTALLDDMAPQMSQIQYAVRANLSKHVEPGSIAKTLVNQFKRVRVIPAVDELPPLTVSLDSDEYRMRKIKSVKRGVLGSKIGYISVSAQQPKPVRVPATKASATENPTPTTVTIKLRFDPSAENHQPPRLATLWSKLKVTTFYATDPWTNFPSTSDSLAWRRLRGVYPETIPLSSRCMASATWKKHIGPTDPSLPFSRRNSTSSTDSEIDSPISPNNVYYTTTLVVPISLPQTKTFIPTFYSCLVARTYTLDLNLSYHTPNPNLINPSMSLRLPIQVGTTESLTKAIKARKRPSNRTSVDEFFTPRSTAPPYAAERARPRAARSDTVNTVTSNISGTSVLRQQTTLDPPDYNDEQFPRFLPTGHIVRCN